MSQTQTTTYYAVSKLTEFEPDPASPFPFPVGVRFPPGCVGAFLVFDSLEPALEWAEGDAGAIRPLRVTITERGAKG